MEKILAFQPKHNFVPESYILPPSTRPRLNISSPPSHLIPVIDVGQHMDRARIVKSVLEASQEFGFFQLINHGIPDELMKEVMEVAVEFFELPREEKSRFCEGGGEDEVSRMSCKLATSLDYEKEQVHFWRDVLRLLCHPIQTHLHSWPHNPPRYREVVGEYVRRVRELSMWVLETISEGLGLQFGYFGNDQLTQVQMMSVNNYPPCPNPSLTLGVPKHSDASLLTVLLQGKVDGLQVLLKDGQWLGVQPIPNALVVNIGNVLQVISNGRLRSAIHRVVTNKELARTTVVYFTNPTNDCWIEPAKALIDDETHPQIYRGSIYKDIRDATVAGAHTGQDPLDFFKIRY
ncbi:Flavanone 3-dioxygenase 2 [Linum grandiflorum]